jgi:Calpain large subunit, domain III
VEEETRVIVKLSQSSQDEQVQSIGFYVVRPSAVFGARRRLEFTRDAMIAKGAFGRNLETNVHLKLPASAEPYLVIPCTFQPGVESDFKLTVYPERTPSGESPKVTLAPVQEWHTASSASAWRGETAGGCLNYHTWRKNPQFSLIASPGTEVS